MNFPIMKNSSGILIGSKIILSFGIGSYTKPIENLTAKFLCSMNSVIPEFTNQIKKDEHGINYMGAEILLNQRILHFLAIE